MRNFLEFLYEDVEEHPLSIKELQVIEKYLDTLFSVLKIDIEFRGHFIDRINDARNKKQITRTELIGLFNKEFAKHGKNIANLDDGEEAVMKDLSTDINSPFLIRFNRQKRMLELVPKTIMRKKGFKTPNKQFVVK